jgi:hypothetical protein
MSLATYDKENRKLRMEAVLTPELVSAQEKPRPPREAVGEIFHSGGHATDPLATLGLRWNRASSGFRSSGPAHARRSATACGRSHR